MSLTRRQGRTSHRPLVVIWRTGVGAPRRIGPCRYVKRDDRYILRSKARQATLQILYRSTCHLRLKIPSDSECGQQVLIVTQPAQQLRTRGSYKSSLAFSQSVVNWFRANGREFPWRHTKDPFHILIAEVLLRQTQAQRVVDPYIELTTMYPDAESLSLADVDDLRQFFRRLGLVRRADHLVDCATRLVQAHGGQVPHDLEQLESLPGIGRYSARAILCLAFDNPVPMVDEGCGRLLRRVFGFDNTGPAYLDSRLLHVAENIIPTTCSREFNLGLIDIAAANCHAWVPFCASCPLMECCFVGSPQRDCSIKEDTSNGPTAHH